MTALEEIKKFAQTTDGSNQELLLALSDELNSDSSGRVMTALEEIKKRAQTADQDLLFALAQQLTSKINTFRDTLLDNINRSVAFYWYALGVTRETKSAVVAAEIWEITRDFFATSLKGWEEVKVPDLPDLRDMIGVIDHLRKVLREHAAKAEEEYRSYKETAFLLHSPENAERLNEALEQANKGKVTRYPSVAEFIKNNRGKVPD
jgi:hypothetical protein